MLIKCHSVWLFFNKTRVLRVNSGDCILFQVICCSSKQHMCGATSLLKTKRNKIKHITVTQMCPIFLTVVFFFVVVLMWYFGYYVIYTFFKAEIIVKASACSISEVEGGDIVFPNRLWSHSFRLLAENFFVFAVFLVPICFSCYKESCNAVSQTS